MLAPTSYTFLKPHSEIDSVQYNDLFGLECKKKKQWGWGEPIQSFILLYGQYLQFHFLIVIILF